MAAEPHHIATLREQLGKQLRALREGAGKTQQNLAVGICHHTLVSHLERARVRADRVMWHSLDTKLGANGQLLAAFDQLEQAVRTHEFENRYAFLTGDSSRSGLSPVNGTSGVAATASALSPRGADVVAPHVELDEQYLVSLHTRVQELVVADNQFGGDHIAPIAHRLFRSVQRKLRVGPRNPGLKRDLRAAAGELGEVAGWLLYDAGQPGLAQQINHEALLQARLAGDSSMELLILQNMSMLAGVLNQPEDALDIARMALERAPSPRLQALFRTREARALALQGQDSAAAQAYQQAHSLYLDGVRDDDPAWAWWITGPELTWHHAMIRADCGDLRSAVDIFEQSAEDMPATAVRGRYCHLAHLLDAQLAAGAWQDADRTIHRLLPYVDEVGSRRTANILFGAVGRLEAQKPPASVRDGGAHVVDLLQAVGYPAPATPR